MDIEDINKKINGISYLMHRSDLEDIHDERLIYKLIYLIQDKSIIDKKTFDKHQKIIEKDLNYNTHLRQSQLNYYSRKLFSENKITLEQLELIQPFLVTKRMRSQSGIIEIAVMTSPGEFSCDFDCYYCPNQPDMPRSYIKEEPAVKRAAENNFDTVNQFYDRASTYSLNGHPVDKVELIVLGGTWSSYPRDYQYQFIRDLYYAANTFFETQKRDRLTLDEEKTINEKALCKIVGLTLETRPDCVNEKEILDFLNFGVTRVQLGIQHTDNNILKKINRQATNEDSIKAIKNLKECGFKVLIHIMPNLPFSNPEKDIEMFDYILDSEDLQVDEWKIYPTSVTTTSDKDNTEVYTVIEKWFNEGKYVPYSNDELFNVVIHAKENIHPYIRISRIFRDIPKPNIVGGANVPNMRQVVQKIMHEEYGTRCNCIRCCEVKNKDYDNNDVFINTISYKASKGFEYFIAYESLDKNNNRLLHAFTRLRLCEDPGLNCVKELEYSAIIRELHVYGQMIPTYKSDKNTKSQHKGYGKKLLKIAEKIAIENGYSKIAIISGVGVRNYYRKNGYHLEGSYMTKKLDKKTNNIIIIGIIFFILFIIATIFSIYYNNYSF